MSKQTLFLMLILSQIAHSVEEYVFRLWELLAPARFLSGLFTDDLQAGFAGFNIALCLFGLWCYVARVAPERRGATGLMWFWVLLEAGNGVGHSLFAILAGGYFPGVGTAPLLMLFAFLLGRRLVQPGGG